MMPEQQQQTAVGSAHRRPLQDRWILEFSGRGGATERHLRWPLCCQPKINPVIETESKTKNALFKREATDSPSKD